MSPFHRVGNTVFVHGGLDPSAAPVDHQAREALLWGTDEFPAEYEGPDLIVYGHHGNAVLDGSDWSMPRFTTSAIGVDTISRGVSSAVALAEGRVIQSARHDA